MLSDMIQFGASPPPHLALAIESEVCRYVEVRSEGGFLSFQTLLFDVPHLSGELKG